MAENANLNSPIIETTEQSSSESEDDVDQAYADLGDEAPLTLDQIESSNELILSSVSISDKLPKIGILQIYSGFFQGWIEHEVNLSHGVLHFSSQTKEAT